MKKVDRWVAVVSILLALFALFIIPREIRSVGSSVIGMSARSYPTFAAVAMAVCGVGLLVNSFVVKDNREAPKLVLSEELKVLLILGVILGYALLCEYLGFFLSTVLVGAALMMIYKDRIWWHYAIYFVFILGCYFLFTNLLCIHLPKLGVWFF